jgi:predicted nuclease with RNAse H fold
MGFRKLNGLDIVEKFCKEGLYVKEIHFHSDDMIGVMKMRERFRVAKDKREIDREIIVK